MITLLDKTYYSLLCIILNLYFICSQEEAYQRLVCVPHTECMGCIQAAEFCHWCFDYEFNKGSLPSCNVFEKLIQDGCPLNKIMKGDISEPYISEDKELSDVLSLDPSSANQIRPQRIKMDLKPGETKSISFKYRLAKNYPLDLYYLMDLTWSMLDDKDTLISLKDDLPKALGNLTTHFRLGFGSFAEKPLMPYAAMDERHRQNPCSPNTCEPTYTFKHRLSLTDKVEDFVTVVKQANVTGNLDNTEATMDALMQVAVCGPRLGWAPESRKIVIIATDGLVHFAGIGKLGGVVDKNDEQCHLDEYGSYTDSTKLDYPSLEQISKVLSKNKINVIFAVTEDVKLHFDKINELLPDTTYVGRLESDSSNILSLVKQGYEDFVSVFSFADNSNEPFQITYHSDCGTGGPVVQTTKCENVKIGETYTFHVNVTMNQCLQGNRKKVEVIEISEGQLENRALTLEITMECECECKSSKQLDVACHNNSQYNCGKCICMDGWVGPQCECNIQESKFDSDKPDRCTPPYGGLVCSGAGDCSCGMCLCDIGFSGEYCQCSECEKNPENQLACSGEGRGMCSCGTCVCRDGWTGPDCSCTTRRDVCTLPGDNETCSGQGECICGKCECNKGSLVYTGTYCDICTNCENSACQLYRDCARTAIEGDNGTMACISSAGNSYITNHVLNTSPPANACSFRIDVCDYPFVYEVLKNRTVMIYVYPKTCPASYQLIIAQGGIAAFLFTILVGIIVLCSLKIYQIYDDRNKYNKFVAEKDMHMKAMGNNEMNPLYKSPISNFRVPEGFDRRIMNRDIDDKISY